MIWPPLLRHSLRHLNSWFIVGSVSEFYLTPAPWGVGIAQVGCHGCKTNLRGVKKDLPWSPAQQAAYLCIVWATCRNLTTGEWKHAILRDLLTDQEQEGRKKVMCWKTQRPPAWQYAINSVFLLSIFFHPSCPVIFLAVKWLERQRSGSFKDKILKFCGTFLWRKEKNVMKHYCGLSCTLKLYS